MMTALLTLPGQSGTEIRRLCASVCASLAERKYDRALADLNRASDLAPEFATKWKLGLLEREPLLGVRMGYTSYLGRGHRRSQSRDVFVIHGRDERLRAGMFDFLRSLDLNPMEWSYAVGLTGKSAPYVGEILDAAFSHAQAVVVLLSPDDMARLRPELCGKSEPPHEVNFTHQARPNVLFESGMAMARHPDRTILVEIGTLRPFSDVGGRHTIRMDNSPKKRQEIAQRLQKAGCPINLSGTDWQTAGDMRPPDDSALPQPTASQAGNSVTKERDYLLDDLISELEDNLERARAPRVGDAYARPSLQVWKNNRNKLALPNHVRSEGLIPIVRLIAGAQSSKRA
jgi:predicted nucleotide-binding protein